MSQQSKGKVNHLFQQQKSSTGLTAFDSVNDEKKMPNHLGLLLGDAVTTAGPYANNVHLAPDR